MIKKKTKHSEENDTIKKAIFITLIIGLFSVPVEATFRTISLFTGEMYDFDTNARGFTFNNSMDLLCILGVVGSDPFWRGGMVNDVRRIAFGDGNLDNNTVAIDSLIGRNWTYDQYRVSFEGAITDGSNHYFVSTDYNYIRIRGSGTGVVSDRCIFQWDDELDLSPIPFFFNETTLTNYNQSDVVTHPHNATFDLYFDYADLGIMHDITRGENQSFNPIGMDVFYETVDNIGALLNQTTQHFAANCFEGSEFIQCIPRTSDGDPRILTSASMVVECQLLTEGISSAIQTLNTPEGVHQYCLYQDDKNNGTLRIDGAFAMNRSVQADPSTTLRNVTFNIAYFTNNTNIISNIRIIPTQPIQNENVTVRFDSSLLSNGTVFYRSVPIPVNSTDLDDALFASAFQNLSTTIHAVDINGSEIVQDRFYQFFVVAGDTVNNNSDNFFNFTVGAFSVFEGDPTAPLAEDIIPNIAIQLGIDFSSFVYILGMVLLLLCTGAAWMWGGEKMGMAVGITVFVSEITVGLLPFFLLIPLLVVMALAVTSIIMKKFGGGM